MQVRYKAHLPALSLWDGENSWTPLACKVFPTLHGRVFARTGISSIYVGSTTIAKTHTPLNTHPEVAATITGLIKTVWWG